MSKPTHKQIKLSCDEYTPIQCKSCEVEFVLVGVIVDENNEYFGVIKHDSIIYCPYCGCKT